MREFRDRGGDVGMVAPDHAMQEEAAPPRTEFHDRGAIPPVSPETGFENHQRTPGTMAFDVDNHRRHQEVQVAEKTADLTGTFGGYHCTWQWVTVTSGGKSEVRLKMQIQMRPDATKLGRGSKVAFLQVVRRSSDGDKHWAKDATDEGMDAKRAARTEDTGFRVDRDKPGVTKTPFYGLKKQDDGSLAGDGNATIGTVGTDDKPWLQDRPEATRGSRMEFLSTATDINSGRQLDAIRWGFYEGFTDMRPEIVAADDAVLGGRDRAIEKFNLNVANDDIDQVPVEYNALDVARMIASQVQGNFKQPLESTLKNPLNNRDDRRAHIRADYKSETGNDLAADLHKVLGADAEKFKAWL